MTVSIALVYPDVLGTYGDGGNAVILARRLEWRGIPAEVETVTLGVALPLGCDIYVLGGGEDLPQALAAASLRSSGFAAVVDRGAVVLAVCAGLQVLGTSFRTAEGIMDGVGAVDAVSVTGLATRAVGELVVDPLAGLGLPRLSGYENHASATVLGPGVSPLGRVASGVGNGEQAGDGFSVGKVLGTYLHGPVLARNPEVADLLLTWVVGELPPLVDPSVDEAALGLRAERLAAVGRDGHRGHRGHHLGT